MDEDTAREEARLATAFLFACMKAGATPEQAAAMAQARIFALILSEEMRKAERELEDWQK